MDMYNIVEGLNKFYETFPNRMKGYFVIQKSIDSNHNVKAHKTYIIYVWFVNDKQNIIATSVRISQRVVTEAEESKIQAELVVILTKSLLEYINSQNFKELCNL